MKKINKNFPEASIEVAYTHGLTLAGTTLAHCCIKSLLIENKSALSWSNIAITISGAFIKPWSKIFSDKVIAAGDKVYYETLPLEVRCDRLRTLDYAVDTEICVSISCDNKTLPLISLSAKAFPQKHFAGDIVHFDELAEFVNPDNSLVTSILDKVDVSAISSVEGDSFQSLRAKAAAIYKIIREMDIDYRNVSFHLGKGIDISDSVDIKSRREANDLDLSLLMAACLEKCGLRSCIVCFDYHVVVGAWVDDAPAPDAAVTSSPENIYAMLDSDRPLLLLVDAVGIVSGKEFDDANYSANMLMLNSDPRRLIDIAEARKAGIKPLEFSKRVAPDESHNAETENHSALFSPLIANNAEKEKSRLPLSENYGLDSSERKALSMAGNGLSFILNAPPRSGRTSVISRIISDACADGKRVLYISDDKTDLLKMKDAIDHCKSSDINAEQIGITKKIGEMTDAMHHKTSDGLSVYDMIDRALAINGDEIRLSAAQVLTISLEQALSIEQDLKALDNYTKEFGCHPSKLPLAGFYPRVSTSRGHARVVAFLEEFPRFYRRVKRRESGILNRWFLHHDAMHYLASIEQWNTFRRLVVIDDKYLCDIETLNNAVSQWYKYRSIIPDWMAFADEVVALGKQGASKAVDYFLEGHTADEAADAFLKGYYTARAKDAVKNNASLQNFKENDLIYHPAASDTMVDDSKTAMLCDMAVVGEKSSGQSYDLVIVDRANNISATDIAETFSHSSQVIFVGDKGLPSKAADVFDNAVKSGLPVCGMKFHYRSGHDSLFTFPDVQFYDNALITLPSVDASASVIHVDPHGKYENGINRQEAQAIVDNVSSIYEKTSHDCQPSMCITALSTSQALLIEKMLGESAELKSLLSDKILRVRSLESVSEHDECDTMIFSIGFAPQHDGVVPLDQLAMSDPERLNLAMTRATGRVVVFSSLLPAHLPYDNSAPESIRILRRFIAYSIDNASLSLDRKRVPSVVDQIKSGLIDRGHVVDTNIGSSGFRVDIAVETSDADGRYALGIVVDSKDNINAIPDVFDREIILPRELNRVGWNIMRVRCVDWFRDPDTVMDRIISALSQ